jgi:broad specificity phosphatase PhoE
MRRPRAHVSARSAQQVSDRLDSLIMKIYDIQRPNMHGEAKADVLLVCLGLTSEALAWSMD